MMDWLKNLVGGEDPEMDPAKKAQYDQMRADIYKRNDAMKMGQGLPDVLPMLQGQNPVQPPPPAMRSDLLGNLLKGIPGANGFPITNERIQQPEAAPVAQEPVEQVKDKAPASKMGPISPKKLLASEAKSTLNDEEIVPVESLQEKPAPAPVAPPVAAPAAAPAPPPENPMMAFIAQLAEAQKQRKDNMMMQNLIRAGATAGSAIAGVAPDKEYLNNLDPMVNEPITSVQEKIGLTGKVQDAARAQQQQANEQTRMGMDKERFGLEKEKAATDKQKNDMVMAKMKSELEDESLGRDPKSMASELTRNFQAERLKEAGYPEEVLQKVLNKNVSKSQLEDLFGKANPDNIMTAKMNAEIRREAMQSKNLQMQLMMEDRKSKHEEKSDKELASRFTKFSESLDATKGRTGALGKVQDKIYAAERLEGLLTQFPDGNIPAIQTRELATSLGALLAAGGSSGTAVSQINELVPHTISGDYAKIASWFTGNPTGQKQQAFIKQFAETAHREKEIANTQIKQALIARIPANEDLRAKDPERFKTMLESRGISEQEYDDFKKGKRPPVVTYPANIENGIKHIMDKNPGATREQVIEELKKQKKLI